MFQTQHSTLRLRQIHIRELNESVGLDSGPNHPNLSGFRSQKDNQTFYNRELLRNEKHPEKTSITVNSMSMNVTKKDDLIT